MGSMKNNAKLLKRMANFFTVFIPVFFIPIISSNLTQHIMPYLRKYDYQDLYISSYIFYIIQFLLAFVLMRLLSNQSMVEWGINLKNVKPSIKIFLYFCLIYGLVIIAHQSILNFILHKTPHFGFALTPKNIAAYLSWLAIMPGISEEMLFRIFAINILNKAWTDEINIGKITITSADIIAALLFMLRHVHFQLSTKGITAVNYDPLQLFMALILGIVYAVVFRKTKSILAPALMHNFSDFGVYGLMIFMVKIRHLG